MESHTAQNAPPIRQIVIADTGQIGVSGREKETGGVVLRVRGCIMDTHYARIREATRYDSKMRPLFQSAYVIS